MTDLTREFFTYITMVVLCILVTWALARIIMPKFLDLTPRQVFFRPPRPIRQLGRQIHRRLKRLPLEQKLAASDDTISFELYRRHQLGRLVTIYGIKRTHWKSAEGVTGSAIPAPTYLGDVTRDYILLVYSPILGRHILHFPGEIARVTLNKDGQPQAAPQLQRPLPEEPNDILRLRARGLTDMNVAKLNALLHQLHQVTPHTPK